MGSGRSPEEALMFTGIVEEVGTVVSREGPRLRIAAKAILDDVELGASIAVNGTCAACRSQSVTRRQASAAGRGEKRSIRKTATARS